MRKRFCLLPALALALLCACSKDAAKTPPTRPADFTSTERQFNTPADGDTIAIFDTSLGEVRAVLYPDAAPMAVYNFVGLARSGYYDNTVIWRAQYGFAVQGGDAGGTGSGGATIWSNNPYPLEADSSLRHYAGALCAAFAQGGECGVQQLDGRLRAFWRSVATVEEGVQVDLLGAALEGQFGHGNQMVLVAVYTAVG